MDCPEGMPWAGSGTGLQGCAEPWLPTDGPTPAGEKGVFHGEVTQEIPAGKSSLWVVRTAFCYVSAQRGAELWGGQPLTFSHRLVMGMSSEMRVSCSCCQAGLLEHTSQGRKQKRRRLLFLKQASNKHLHVPSISQLYKTPETLRFPKCFLII